MFIIQVFIGILRDSIEIQFLAKSFIEFNKEFNQIWNRVAFIFIMVFIPILGAP